MVIENHLKDHTYITDKTHERVNTRKMRKRINSLTDVRIIGSIYEPEPGGSRTDAIFRRGSSLMPSEVLARYKYDKNTFLETELPAYIPHSESNTESHTPGADPALAHKALSPRSKKSKRKHSEVADPDNASKETSANMFNEINSVKRQAKGRSENDSSHDGETQFAVPNEKAENTPKALPPSSEISRPHEPTMIRYDDLPPALSEFIEPGSLNATPSFIPEPQQDLQ